MRNNKSSSKGTRSSTSGKNKKKQEEKMKKVGVRNLRGDKWEIERNLVLKEGKMYMSKDEKLSIEIIWLHHDVPVAGHGGR